MNALLNDPFFGVLLLLVSGLLIGGGLVLAVSILRDRHRGHQRGQFDVLASVGAFRMWKGCRV